MFFGFIVVSMLLAIFAGLSANAAGLIILTAVSFCIGVIGMLVNYR